MDFARDPATFVIPHWTPDFRQSQRHLEATLHGILRQTDANWRIVLIDDASPDPAARAYLQQIERHHPNYVHVIFKTINEGAGVCRNLGIRWAHAQLSPIVLYNDADDLSDPRRLEVVRRIFVEHPATGVVYSTFWVIDQDGQVVPLEEMTASVAEVLEAHRHQPPQGQNAWIAIGTETGYINHTSSTAVSTDLAVQFPFPAERVSEDSHTWFRYSAGVGPLSPSMSRYPRIERRATWPVPLRAHAKAANVASTLPKRGLMPRGFGKPSKLLWPATASVRINKTHY